MTTAIVSDLHLGLVSRNDLLRHEGVRAALVEALGEADHLVLLGDAVELREGPARAAFEVAEPVLAELGKAMAGGRVTLVAGNHDHQIAGPLIERVRLEGRPLEAETLAEAPGDGLVGAVARALAPAEVRVAYPGVWVRDDVFATHGHYLDVHNTVPTLERLAIGTMQRVRGGRVPEGPLTPDDYEAAVAPVYALGYALAQHAGDRRPVRQDRSLKMWHALSGNGRRTISTRLLADVAFPAAIRALNLAGLGPLEAEVSGTVLRESALRAMRTTVERLGIDARHVVFGHTHRSGPHRGEAGWGGLVNSGSWVLEPQFLGDSPRESPYFPGHVVLVRDEGPPELVPLLEEMPHRLTRP